MQSSKPARWTLASIPYERIDVARTRVREDLFYLVTAASFVEIASDLYTRNLVSYFQGDNEVAQWLNDHWQHEEVQHGEALRAYVERVWPDFDWQRAYQGFFGEYSRLCTVDEFEPTRGLEMVARCVVEMGTATYYRALCECAQEPVLALLADHIRADEVRHYKHFFRYFKKYNVAERKGRLRVMGALKRRLLEVRNDDAEIALWHTFHVREPHLGRDSDEFRAMFTAVRRAVQGHYPVGMAIKMLLKPLALPGVVQQVLAPPLSKLTQHWILR